MKKRRRPQSWRERLVLRSLKEVLEQPGKKPPWLHGARLSTPTEDHSEKKDVVVHTDTGDLYLQVLSTKVSVRSWWRQHGPRDRLGIVRFGRSYLNRPAWVWPLVKKALEELRLKALETREAS